MSLSLAAAIDNLRLWALNTYINSSTCILVTMSVAVSGFFW